MEDDIRMAEYLEMQAEKLYVFQQPRYVDLIYRNMFFSML